MMGREEVRERRGNRNKCLVGQGDSVLWMMGRGKVRERRGNRNKCLVGQGRQCTLDDGTGGS